MTLMELLNQMIQECEEKTAKIDFSYNKGIITSEKARNERVRIAFDAWEKVKRFCKSEGIDPDNEADHTYQVLFASVGIPVKKVPVRYYPTVEKMTGSLCYLYELENAESLLAENNPIGKTFHLRKSLNVGDEKISADYFFKVIKEDSEYEMKDPSRKGWKCFDGYGKLEGYQWAEAFLYVREYNGILQAAANQKIYIRDTEPIWKKHSADPVEGHWWIGINEEIPYNLEIPEGEFYYDATIAPPRGRHYREEGILAYDDEEEIVILGITDPEAEVVKIPHEINGKPVTILDERCFANCSDRLRKVILPDTIKVIGDSAFDSCIKLEKPCVNCGGGQARVP